MTKTLALVCGGIKRPEGGVAFSYTRVLRQFVLSLSVCGEIAVRRCPRAKPHVVVKR